MSSAFFYELILSGIENFQPIALSPPPLLRSLIRCGLELSRRKTPFLSLPEAKQNELVGHLEDLLKISMRREMLKTFFALEISESMQVMSLPIVLANYAPDLSLLPSLMLRLCTKVNYLAEKECVRGVSLELAHFFAFQTLEPAWPSEGEEEDLFERSARARQIEHVVFSAIRGSDFRPPKTLASDGAVRQIASIDQLYKVFERC